MSVKQENENLEKKVVVNENEEVETTELVETEVETKGSKLKKVGKTMLKVAGVAGVGLLGFILGAKCSKKSDEEDYEAEVVEAEIIDEE